jgi:hypothetical protein
MTTTPKRPSKRSPAPAQKQAGDSAGYRARVRPASPRRSTTDRTRGAAAAPRPARRASARRREEPEYRFIWIGTPNLERCVAALRIVLDLPACGPITPAQRAALFHADAPSSLAPHPPDLHVARPDDPLPPLPAADLCAPDEHERGAAT